jgi:Polysulphide reductase, NrfD
VNGGPAMVPEAEPRSYYGQPVIKQPVWTWEVPWYFFAGGMAGTSTGVAFLADLRGNHPLARRSWLLALGGVGVGTGLLISDLGKPTRFLNMLRVVKVTSPMSMGSWLLTATGAATTVAAAHSWTGVLEGPARFAKPAAAVLGLPISTYTAALVANTAVPVWHEARLTLPFLFAAGAAISAGAAGAIVTPPRYAGPARRLAVAGAAAEAVTSKLMEQRLGELGSPYHEGQAGRLNRISDVLTVAGGLLLASFGRRRGAAVASGALLLAGAAAKRWAVFKAGFQSAADPAQTVGPQRRRIREGEAGGAERTAI